MLERIGRTYSPLDGFELSVELFDLGVPPDVIVEAGQAITAHMGSLARELSAILREHLTDPFRAEPRTAKESEELTRVLNRLRGLTVRAIVSGFHRVTGEAGQPPASV